MDSQEHAQIPSGRALHELLEEALANERASREQICGVSYIRVRDDLHALPRGSVFLDERRVPAYPPIARICNLRNGLRRAFGEQPFRAEEKLDGYNVRVVRHHGRLLPFTKGGFLCPFTADRLQDLGEFEDLFRADPELVLCGEVVGPGNPYIDTDSPHAREDVRFFGFDLMRLDEPLPLPLSERDELFERYTIPGVPGLGTLSVRDSGTIADRLLELGRQGSEGLIFKPEHQGLRVKYVTPQINISDIEQDASLLAELPTEFFRGRLLRLVLSIEELGLDKLMPEAEQRVGRALVGGFLPALRQLKSEGRVTKQFSLRLHSHQAADALLEHLNRASRKVQARELERSEREGWVQLRFEKIFQSSTSRLHALLNGEYEVD